MRRRLVALAARVRFHARRRARRPGRIIPAVLAAAVLTGAAAAPAGCGPDTAANQQYGAGGGTSAFQRCVIARESSGRPQVMNSSGHYGLYQFDYPTWVSGGGMPADFGRASVAEQDRVFAAVYAARGAEPWRPYDGC